MFLELMQRVEVEGLPPTAKAPAAAAAAAASASAPAAALAVAQASGAQQTPAPTPAAQQTPAPPAVQQAQMPASDKHPSSVVTGPTTADWSGYQIELWNNSVYTRWRGSWWKLSGPDPRYREYDSKVHRWTQPQ